MTDAIGYTRLSQQSDTSIDRQKRNIRDEATTEGFDLVDILDDGERTSGFDADREEYQNLRDLVEDGSIDVVLVNDKRRLARDFDETMRLILDVREQDIGIHTCQEGRLDVSDPMQAAIEVLQAASEHEAKLQEIEKARQAVSERVEAGYWQGRTPFGLELDDDNQYLVPGQGYERAIEAIRLRDDGTPWRAISEKTDISLGTVQRIYKNRERYQEQG